MGRPKKPTQVKRLKGTLQKCRTPKGEWTPPAGAPPMPEALSPREAREWRRLCDLLTAAGVMTVADGDALEGYVKALEMARQAEAMLQKDGLVVEAAEGEKAHPAVSIAKHSRLAVKQFGALFGLDPSSRAALNVPKPEKTDEIGDFLSGKSRGLSVVK